MHKAIQAPQGLLPAFTASISLVSDRVGRSSTIKA